MLILMTSLTPSVTSQPYPEYEQEWSFNIPCYAPAKINVNFVYTHNHTIRDISCLGTTSLYRHSGGPTNLLFEAEDYDTYKFTLELFYANITHQHLTIGIWSGTQQVQPSLEYDFYTMHVIIHITLQVTEEPKFPTPEEWAEAQMWAIKETLDNATRTLYEKISLYEKSIFLIEVVAIVALMAAVVSVIVTISMYKRR